MKYVNILTLHVNLIIIGINEQNNLQLHVKKYTKIYIPNRNVN